MNTYVLLLLITIGWYTVALSSPSTRHIVYIRTPHDVKRALFSVTNNNDNQNNHTIVQMNNNTTHTDFMPTLPPAQLLPPPDTASLLSSWIDYGKKHQVVVAMGMITLGLGSFYGALAWIEYRLNGCDAWACWLSEYSLEVLATLPPQRLAEDLFNEIKKRYRTGNDTPLDFLNPLLCFTRACDKELWLLSWIKTIRTKCSQLPLLCWLPGNAQALEDAHIKIERLRFLKQILISELSSYTWDEQKVSLEIH